MGKEGDLWDDSALINAFDDAMTKYKKMHSKKDENISSGGKNIISNIEENVNAITRESNAAMRPRDAEENCNLASNAGTDMSEIKNLPEAKENHLVDSHAPESYIDSSSGVHMKGVEDAPRGYSYTQGPVDYNQLLMEYYEVEEKRQKILQHLYQSGNWNYHFPGESSYAAPQGVMNSTSQEYPVASSQASYPNVDYSCCPYVRHWLEAPCALYPACSSGVTCVGNTCNGTSGAAKPLSLDGDIVKTAMGAAKRAISSMKMKTPANLNVNEENVEREDNKEETDPSTGSETDLAAVLNAWYSAGFYTAKYLAEQSIAKKKHQ